MRNELPRLRYLVPALAALAVFPIVFESNTFQNTAILVLLYSFWGQAWNILGGYVGQVSFCHAVFVGIGASDTLQPGQADAIDFFGYAAGGPHRALAQAGVLDILPSHYSHLPGLIRAGVLPVDVVLLQVSPPDAQGRYSLGLVQEYLPAEAASDLVPGADGFGPIRSDLAVAPVLKGGETVAWAFITSDFVGTTGYSGKPIHSLVAVDKDAKIVGVRLVKHSEPIVLIGIPEAKVKAPITPRRSRPTPMTGRPPMCRPPR